MLHRDDRCVIFVAAAGTAEACNHS